MEKQSKKFSLLQRARSFTYAFNGLRYILKKEHNMWIHLLAAVAAIILGLVLQISNTEWLFLAFAICFVLAMEIINSSVEKLCDFVSPGRHPSIEHIKDMAAAAVLISAIAALVAGLIIFVPKFINIH